MRKACICALSLCFSLLANAKESEENLAFRRTLLLYQEGDYSYAGRAIEDFLDRYPASEKKEELYAVAGHIAFESNDYERALFYYNKIAEGTLKNQIENRRWHSYFLMSHFKELAQEVAIHEPSSELARFYLAHCLFQMAIQQDKSIPLLNEALLYFRKLEDGVSFVLDAKEAIVVILDLLGQKQKKEEALDQLANSLLAHSGVDASPLAYKCAFLLLQENPSRAIQLLTHVLNNNGKKNTECASLLFSQLAKSNNFEALPQYEKILSTHLPAKERALFHFLMGKMYSQNNESQLALKNLEKTLVLPLEPPYDYQSMVLLMNVAHKESSLSTLEKVYHECQRRFGADRALISQVEVLLAAYFRQIKDFERAQDLIKQALATSPESTAAAIEMMHLLADQGKIEQADEMIHKAIQKKPQSKELLDARISLLIRAEKESGPLEIIQKKKNRAIMDAIAAKDLFTKQEQNDFQIMLVKSLLAQKNSHEALVVLKSKLLEEEEPSCELSALAAYAYFNVGDYKRVIEYGEQALKNPSLGSSLFLPLYNAYIAQAKEKNDLKLQERASFHLYNAIAAKLPISLENKLWLYHQLSEKARLFGDGNAADQALSIIEPIIQPLTEPHVPIDNLEREIVTAASLWAIKGCYERSLSLLQCLSQKLPQSAFEKIGDDVRFIEAEVYLAQSKRELALEHFRQLENSTNAKIASLAKLQTIWINCLLKEKKRMSHEEHRTFISQLAHLKSERNALTEPAHLQAALDFADLSAKSFSDHERPKRLCHLLKEIKESFLSEDDLASKDYHETLNLFPERQKLFASYMRYLDGWILSLEAEMSDDLERQEKEKRAQLFFSSLEHETSPYLRSRMGAATKK